MIEGEREEFEKLLAELYAGIDKPLSDATREAFWKGLTRMSLVEFMRCRDLLLRELEENETPRRFSVADVWAAKRRLRARAAVEIPEQQSLSEAWDGDDWDAAANLHLLKHIRRTLAVNSKRYSEPPTCLAMRTMSRATRPNADASPLFVANVKHLVRAKNAWAADMRDLSAVNGGVPSEVQKSIWGDYIREAERAIAAANPTINTGEAA